MDDNQERLQGKYLYIVRTRLDTFVGHVGADTDKEAVAKANKHFGPHYRSTILSVKRVGK